MIYYALHEANQKIGRCSYPQVQDFESDPGRLVTDPDFVYQLRNNIWKVPKLCKCLSSPKAVPTSQIPITKSSRQYKFINNSKLTYSNFKISNNL